MASQGTIGPIGNTALKLEIFDCNAWLVRYSLDGVYIHPPRPTAFVMSIAGTRGVTFASEGGRDVRREPVSTLGDERELSQLIRSLTHIALGTILHTGELVTLDLTSAEAARQSIVRVIANVVAENPSGWIVGIATSAVVTLLHMQSPSCRCLSFGKLPAKELIVLSWGV